jgi:hypothetical protein
MPSTGNYVPSTSSIHKWTIQLKPLQHYIDKGVWPVKTRQPGDMDRQNNWPPLIYRIHHYANTSVKILDNRSQPGELSRYSDSLRAGRSGDRIPVKGKIFCTRPRESWGPPSHLYNGYRVSFPVVNLPGRGVDPHSHILPRLQKEQSYASAPSLDLHGLLQGRLTFTFYSIKEL